MHRRATGVYYNNKINPLEARFPFLPKLQGVACSICAGRREIQFLGWRTENWSIFLRFLIAFPVHLPYRTVKAGVVQDCDISQSEPRLVFRLGGSVAKLTTSSPELQDLWEDNSPPGWVQTWHSRTRGGGYLSDNRTSCYSLKLSVSKYMFLSLFCGGRNVNSLSPHMLLAEWWTHSLL